VHASVPFVYAQQRMKVRANAYRLQIFLVFSIFRKQEIYKSLLTITNRLKSYQKIKIVAQLQKMRP
jgi:hypothetical protein